jgi:NADH:ubiquinone oxidoreductase subunit E
MFKGMFEWKRGTAKPRGRHLIRVCLGTYCNVKNRPILDSIERALGINPGETTRDGKFTLKIVNCLDRCNLGPVIEIDGQYYERLSPADIGKALSSYN